MPHRGKDMSYDYSYDLNNMNPSKKSSMDKETDYMNPKTSEGSYYRPMDSYSGNPHKGKSSYNRSSGY